MAGDYYSRISARFWIDTKGWNERNRLVALYLLTNGHRSMEGLYHLPLGYVCVDLGLSQKQVEAALRFIEDVGIVAYDHEAEVVFICKALKHAAPKTENHVKGAIARLKSVPTTCLWDDFLMACECHASELRDGIRLACASFAGAHARTRIELELELEKEVDDVVDDAGARERDAIVDSAVVSVNDKRLVDTVAVLRECDRLTFDLELMGVAGTLTAHPNDDHLKAARLAVVNATNPNYRTTDAGKALWHAFNELQRNAPKQRNGNTNGPAPKSKPWDGSLKAMLEGDPAA